MVYELVLIMISGILLITGIVYKKYRMAIPACLLMFCPLFSLVLYFLFSVKYILTVKIFAYAILAAVTAIVILSFLHSKFIKTFFSVIAAVLAALICVIASVFIGVTSKTCDGKDYVGLYEKMNKNSETVVTYYESKGFLLVSKEYCFKENYGIVQGDKDVIFDREPYETEFNPSCPD